MSHSKFKWKSTGLKFDNRRYKREVTKELPLGIKTPLQNKNNGNLFETHTDMRMQLQDNLKNLIMTNTGERLCLTNFGANLKNILFDYSSLNEYEQVAKQSIVNAAQIAMPNISIRDISVLVLDQSEKQRVNLQGMAKVKIIVNFDVPKIRASNLKVQVEMFVGG